MSDPHGRFQFEPQFRPPWYLRSGHLQTLITGFYRPIANLPPRTTLRCPLPENQGNMLMHENLPEGSDDYHSKPSVLLLHGLGSSHAGTYMTNMALGFVRRGFRVFRVDLPGAGDSYLETPLPPHGACSSIIRNAMQHVSDLYGIKQWYMAGVSLGGNILLRMLSDPNHQNACSFEVLRAIALAPPIDLDSSCRNIERGIHRLYANYFLRAIRKQIRERAKHWPQWKERLDVADFSSLRRLDDTVTAPLAGFQDAFDYYTSGSSKPFLKNLTTRTKILIDRHDPIVPYFIFRDAEFSPSTEVIVTNRGGHVGYLRRRPMAQRSKSLQRSGIDRKFHRWGDSWIVDTMIDDECW